VTERYQYDNTRQWVRRPCEWYVKYTLPGRPGPSTVVKAADASGGGVRVTTREPVDVGATVSLQIHVAALQRVVSVVGRVVRSRPVGPGTYEWAVYFEQVAGEDRAALNHHIERMAGPGRAGRHEGRWWRTV